jgi:two-component system, cell cycle sensor histidine kinase and response regulator CckA
MTRNPDSRKKAPANTRRGRSRKQAKGRKGGRKVTAARQDDADVQLGLILDAIPEPAFLIEPHGTVLRANPAAVRRSGLPTEHIVGRPLCDLTPSESSRIQRRQIESVARTGRSARLTQQCDGRLIQHVVSPIRVDDGRVTRLVVLHIDMTDRERAETDRQALREQLHQAQKMEALGQLAAGVAHDFNNALTVIRGYITQACAVLPPDHEARGCLGRILDATHQATGLTRSLLTFSRRLPGERRPLDLRQLVDESARMIQAALPASVMMEIDNPSSPPLWVEVDESQIRQVILNLAINARDAMPEGGHLRIRLAPVDDQAVHGAGRADRPSRWAVLLVEDTGIGIPPEHLKRVFEPFFTTKPRGEHSGLGLAIVLSVVEGHGGEVAVQSQQGEGTVFAVRLPCAQARADNREQEEPTSMPRGDGHLVLLAESNPHVGGIIALTLESLGYQVIQVTDAAAALETARRRGHLIRAVILETDLPGGHGLTCLRQMREQGIRVPAIVLTGGQPSDPLKPDAGTALLAKPFDMPDLAQLVYNAVQDEPSKETRS